MRNNRHLLFIAPSAYPLGGVATWLDYILPSLGDMGWFPVLGLVSGDWHNAKSYLDVHPYEHVVTIDNPTGSAQGRIRSLKAAIRKQQPALVLGVNLPDTYSAVAQMRLSGEAAPRVAMTIHGIEPDLYEDVSRYGSVLDAVVCTNRLACRMAIEDGGLRHERVHYAPYGVTIPTVNQRVSSQQGPSRIAYVGRMDQWQKRVLDLPAILEGLERGGVDYRLDLAGTGPEEPALKETLAGRIDAGKVRFLGTLSSHELVEQVYNNSDVLLLTSYWETGPIVIWEAMAHGVAVVSSSYIGSGLENGLKSGENCLLFPTGDVAAAANALPQLSDRELHAKLVKGGKALIRERYSLKRSVENWDRCIKNILAANPSDTAPDLSPPAQSGRLDRLLGVSTAETVRRLLGIRFHHLNPGGEWPHSNGSRALQDEPFWKQAEELDQR